jgi:hypothetical protein
MPGAVGPFRARQEGGCRFHAAMEGVASGKRHGEAGDIAARGRSRT